MAPKRRGRPPLAKRLVKADEVIAAAVDQLVMWGFPSVAVFEAVGVGARDVLERSSTSGGALGGDRVEQIWESLRPTEYYGRVLERDDPLLTRKRSRWTKAGLQSRAPGGDLKQLVEALLRNGGVWPEDDGVGRLHGDVALTPKFANEVGDLPLVRVDENGVKK